MLKKAYFKVFLIILVMYSFSALGANLENMKLLDSLQEAYKQWLQVSSIVEGQPKISNDEFSKRQNKYELLKNTITRRAIIEKNLSNNSLLKALFEIQNNELRYDCIPSLIKNMKVMNISQMQKQYIVNELLIFLGSNKSDQLGSVAYFEFLLCNLPEAEYYSEDSLKIVEKFTMENKCNALIYDFFDLSKQPDIYNLLKKNMSLLSESSDLQGKSQYLWACTCVLAKHGDTDAIKKIKAIVKNTDKLCQQHIDVARIIPIGLAYTQKKELIELIFPMLESKIAKFHGEDCIPPTTQLAHKAAFALWSCVKDFPKINNWEFSDHDKKKCFNWVKSNKNNFEITKQNYPYYIQNSNLGAWVN